MTKDLNEIETAIGDTHTYIMNEALSEKRIHDEQKEDNGDDNGSSSSSDNDDGVYRRREREHIWFKEILKAPDEVQDFLKMVVVLPLIDMGYRFSDKTCICPFNKKFHPLWEDCGMTWFHQKYQCECSNNHNGVNNNKKIL